MDSTLTAEVVMGFLKRYVSLGLALVTKEFHCVFQLFFSPRLSPFYNVVALKVAKSKPSLERHAYLFTATFRLSNLFKM